MASTYRYSSSLASQPGDPAGRRWFVKEYLDETVEALDLRAELLARAAYASGGVAVGPSSVSLDAATATIEGPIVAITEDGFAPLIADPSGAGVELDLADLGDALGDGTHAIVIRAVPVTTTIPFTTPEVPLRDQQGRIVETTAGASVSYTVRRSLGILTLIDGVEPDGAEAIVATVEKSGSAWSNLAAAASPPLARSSLAAIVELDSNHVAAESELGATYRATDDLLLELGPGFPRGWKAELLNDTDDRAVAVATIGGATLATKAGAALVGYRGAVTILSLGADAWRAYGDLIGAGGSGS
jgi:hypothetical protein